MNPEIKTLLENMEFHESKDKPGLWSKAIDETESGIMGVTAFVDFRRATEKGRRFYTIEGIDGFRDDADLIPTLAYFKRERDRILGISDNKTPAKEQGSLTPPNKQSSNLPASGEPSNLLLVPAGTIKDAVELFKGCEDI